VSKSRGDLFEMKRFGVFLHLIRHPHAHAPVYVISCVISCESVDDFFFLIVECEISLDESFSYSLWNPFKIFHNQIFSRLDEWIQTLLIVYYRFYSILKPYLFLCNLTCEAFWKLESSISLKNSGFFEIIFLIVSPRTLFTFE